MAGSHLKKYIPILLFIVIVCTLSLCGLERRLNEKELEDQGLPAELYGQQKKLHSLSLSSNIADNISWLDGPIETLELTLSSYQRLSELHSAVRNLTLENTKLKNLSGIKKLNVTTLHLKGNKRLSDLSALAGHSTLQTLIVENNGVVRLFPWASLSVSRLEIINTTIDGGFKGAAVLPQIEELFLDGKKDKNPTPNQWRLDHPSLRKLTLRATDIKALPLLPSDILKLTLLSNNDLRNLNGLDQVSGSLQYLELQKNRHLKIDHLPTLLSLEILKVHCKSDLDKITSLAEKTPHIHSLFLFGVLSSSFEPLGNLSALKELHLLNNDNLLSLLSLPKSLKVLNLRDQIRLDSTDFADISKLAQLTSLTISRCDGLEQLDLTQLSRLKRLVLENNDSLTNLIGLKSHPNLSHLDLRDNPRIKLSNLNELPFLMKFSWQGRSNLGLACDIDSNSIGMVFRSKGDKSIQLSQAHLVQLDLSGNNAIDSLKCVATFQNLEVLNLARTKVSDLEPLHSLESLKRLDLRYSKVRSLKGLPDYPEQRLSLILTSY